MPKFNIERAKFTPILAYATHSTIISTTAALNGLLSGVIFTVPDLDSTNTATLEVIDADNNVVYTKATQAKSTTSQAYVDTNNHPLRIPLGGTYTIKITTSGAQTANRTFGVALLVNHGI